MIYSKLPNRMEKRFRLTSINIPIKYSFIEFNGKILDYKNNNLHVVNYFTILQFHMLQVIIKKMIV